MRNIQFSSPVDALWQENEFAKNALLASHVVSSESSNVYTGAPYSGWGPGIDTFPLFSIIDHHARDFPILQTLVKNCLLRFFLYLLKNLLLSNNFHFFAIMKTLVTRAISWKILMRLAFGMGG